MPEAVIVDTVRTPIGRAFKGSLAQLRPDEIGAFDHRPAARAQPRTSTPPLIEDVFCGVGMPQGLQAFNIARIIVLLSEKLAAGDHRRHRLALLRLQPRRDPPRRRTRSRPARATSTSPPASSSSAASTSAPRPAGADDQNENLIGEHDGQPERLHRHGHHRGQRRREVRRQPRRAWTSTRCARRTSRSSRRRTASSTARSSRSTLPDGTVVAKDDGPRADVDMREKLGSLPEAFGGGGVTAGNSCPLNDGAAAVLIMSDTKAKELGLTPRARIVTAATAGNEPEYMGVAPIGAIKKVLDRAGMTIDDIDTVELNEAFAAQVIPIMDECGIPMEKLNTHGGAIALGHPFGMTGARIMGTLLNVMETDDHSVGIETMCVAGGQGEAMIVERL